MTVLMYKEAPKLMPDMGIAIQEPSPVCTNDDRGLDLYFSRPF